MNQPQSNAGGASPSKFEARVAVAFVLSIMVIVLSYLVRYAWYSIQDVGLFGVVIFLAAALCAWCLSRIKNSSQKFYGGIQIFFGLGAMLNETLASECKPIAGVGCNIEWNQMGVVMVAILFVADGFANAWKPKADLLVAPSDGAS